MAFYTVGGKNYTLASSISSTATSITLTSFTLPVTDQAITMATANTSIMYGTIQPGTTNSEFISFTGITQNGDGTATLTGVTRGLDREYPYTEASAFKLPHPGQSVFILSDAPQVFAKYPAIVNDETIAGKWTFPNDANTPLIGASYVAPTINNQVATKKYVDDTAVAGAPDANTTTKGIAKLSYAPVSSTNPISVGDNDPRIAPNNYTTTTGSANAYVLTLTSAPSAYAAGQVYSFKANFANTGTATININSLGAKTIKTSSGTNLIANDILNNQIVAIEYDGTDFIMISNSGNGEMTLAGAQTVTGVKTFSAQPLGIQSVNYQAFTSSGTWTKPTGLTGNELVIVQLWGAGGGGGGSSTSGGNYAGGGGGGAYTEAKFRANDLSSTVSVTIGTGGAGGTGGVFPTDGSVGGNSTFGSYMTAYGGGGGSRAGGGAATAGGGGGGNTGAGSTATNTITGATGGSIGGGSANLTSAFGGGGGGSQSNAGGGATYGGGGGGGSSSAGGASYFGGGGGGGGNIGLTPSGGTSIIYGGNGGAGGNNANGSNGVAPGGGGGGSADNSGAGKTGGTGARGECRVFVQYYAN